jgi:tetratricopeptide (TPR) repeat protein
MTRLNVKLVVILAIALVVLSTGVVVVHGIQMNASVDSLLKRAEKAKDENPQTALRLYQLYRNYKPNDTEHYADFAMFAADVALKPGASGRDYGIAIRELEQILRGDVPESREAELRKKLIDLDLNVGRFADAKEHLLMLKKKNQGDADADLKLARCQAFTSHYLEAAELLYAQIGYNPKTKKFDIAKATSPNELGAYTMLVQVLRDRLIDSQMIDRKEIADAVIEQMISANPKSAKAYLAQAQFAQDAEVAKAAIASAMELAPEDPDVLAHTIEIALAGKNFDQAEELIAKAIKIAPKDDRFYRYEVSILDLQKKSAEAGERLEAALKVLPDSPGLLLMQFDRQLQKPDLPAARVTLKQLSAAKILPAVRGFLEAKLLFAEGDHQAASQKLENLRPQLSKIPQLVAQADMLLLQCYDALGQLDQREKVAGRLPGTIPAEVVTADRLAKTGKFREALDIYEALAKALEKQNQLAAVPQVPSAVLQMRIAVQMSKPKEQRNWQDVDAWFEKMRELGLLKPPADSLVEAEILVRKGETDQAAEILSGLQKKYPDNSAVAGMRAGMLLQNGKSDDALKLIENSSAELRNSPALIGAKIEAQFVAGRPADEVKSSLTKISGEIDKLPADVQARTHIALGVAYLRLNDRASAELEWKKAAELQPNDAKIRWLMFDVARQSGDVPAMEALQGWFAKEFGRDDAQSKLAEAAIIVVKVREGLKAKYGSQPDQLTLSEQDHQSLAKARDLLREVNNSRSGWVENPRLLAEINVLENRYEEAISNLQDVISVGQPTSQTLKQLVTLLHFRQRDADARELMNKYASLLSGEDMNQLSIDVDMKTGNKDKALEKFEAQYDKNSQDPAAHLYAGRVFSTAGKGEQAEAAFRKAVELAPALPDAWLALVTQLAMNKKGDEALKVVQEAQIKLPEDARNGVLAQGYEVVGDQAQAEHYYLATLEASPNNPAALRSAAAYYLRTNRREDAEKQLDKLMNAAADSGSDRENVAWARRATAQLWASDGNYQKFLKALDLIAPQGRKPTAEDVSARLALLLDRTDPVSTRQALRSLDELKQIRSLSVQERIAAARLNERLGEWFKARDEMNDILALPKPDTGARLTYAEMLLRRGEIDEAESQLRTIKEVESQYAPQMAMLTAKILSARGRGADAGNLLANLLPKERPLPSAQVPLLNAIASALEEIHQYEQAEKFLREYVAYEPGQMLRLAEFLARRGKVDAALDLAEGYRRAFPTVQLLAIGMAALHQNVTPPTAQQIARVEQWITQAQREEDTYQVQLLLADLRDFQRNYPETEKVYRGILNRADAPAQTRAEVMNNLAFLLAMQGRDIDEALKLINDAVVIYGPQSDMLDTRGVVNLIKGDTKQAVADLTDAVIATDPKPIKYVHLAMAQAAAKDLVAARKSLETAKSLKFSRDDLSPLEKQKFEELLKQLNMTV